MKIGRHEFAHHLFVSRQEEIGASFDIILGQPFLHYFSASINYSRSGQVMLLLWKDGNRDGGPPTISISIVNLTDVRNKFELARSTHMSRGNMTCIQEVVDEDFL
ncbi:hypothetical protein BDZ89DRAFT_1150131 [Hymenopellis radicata]|nr:hypothetical protein BDZ89DRAFT_1150131 [Hymenopellis radicata]